MITASEQGRRLVLTVEQGEDEPQIAPFVLSPLPMNVGKDISHIYLGMARAGAGGPAVDYSTEDLFAVIMDGADPDTGLPWLDDDGQRITPNTKRAERELTQAEAEEILMKGLLWHSILGLEGIAEYDKAGGGVTGTLKATALLLARMANLPSLTSPNSASAPPTPTGAIRDTSTRPGGATRERLPRNRRSIRQNRP